MKKAYIKVTVGVFLLLALAFASIGCGDEMTGTYYQIGGLSTKDGKLVKPITMYMGNQKLEFKSDTKVICYDGKYEKYDATYELQEINRININLGREKLHGTITKAQEISQCFSEDEAGYRGEKIKKIKMDDGTTIDANETYKMILIGKSMYILID